jgi:hypothetical protein
MDGNSQSFLEILNALGVEQKVNSENVVTYNTPELPFAPRKSYSITISDNLIIASTPFDTGEKARKRKLLYSKEDNFHYNWQSEHFKDYVEDGEINVHTMAFITNCCARPELKHRLESTIDRYNLDEIVFYKDINREMTLKERMRRYVLCYEDRAIADLTIRMMKEIINARIPVTLSVAKSPHLIAVNEVSLQY